MNSTTTVFCRSCGQPVSADAKFCRGCGAEQAEREDGNFPQNSSSQSPINNTRKWLYAALGGFLIVGVLTLVTSWSNRKTEERETQEYVTSQLTSELSDKKPYLALYSDQYRKQVQALFGKWHTESGVQLSIESSPDALQLVVDVDGKSGNLNLWQSGDMTFTFGSEIYAARKEGNSKMPPTLYVWDGNRLRTFKK